MLVVVFSIIPQMEKQMTTKVLLSYAPREAHPAQDITPLFSEASFPPLQTAVLLAHGGDCAPKKKGQKAQCKYQIPVNGERGLWPLLKSVQFSRSGMSDSATPWTAARQASLSITKSRSPPKLMSIELNQFFGAQLSL